MSSDPHERALEAAAHEPTRWPSDGENCRYCRAWSDAEWALPCPATPEHRAMIDAAPPAAQETRP